MAASERTAEPIRIHITRIPQARIIFGDYDDCVVQALGEDVPHEYVGTEYDLWRWFRVFAPDVLEQLAEKAEERARAQAIRMSALEEKNERLANQLKAEKERGRHERDIRASLEKELESRDGYNRTSARLSQLRDQPSGEVRRP